MLLRRVLVPLRREHVSDKVPLHCMDSLVPTASYPSTYSPLAVGRANSFVVCPPCPPCLCAVAGLLPQLHRGRGIYALRVLPLLCTTTHGSAKDDHSCGRRGRRRRRRWRLERGDAALSASCPPRARANARALESATSPVRPKCGLRRAARARSRAASQARAVEMSAVHPGGREYRLDAPLGARVQAPRLSTLRFTARI